MKTDTEDNVIVLGLRVSQGKAGQSPGFWWPSMFLPHFQGGKSPTFPGRKESHKLLGATEYVTQATAQRLRMLQQSFYPFSFSRLLAEVFDSGGCVLFVSLLSSCLVQYLKKHSNGF